MKAHIPLRRARRRGRNIRDMSSFQLADDLAEACDVHGSVERNVAVVGIERDEPVPAVLLEVAFAVHGEDAELAYFDILSVGNEEDISIVAVGKVGAGAGGGGCGIEAESTYFSRRLDDVVFLRLGIALRRGFLCLLQAAVFLIYNIVGGLLAARVKLGIFAHDVRHGSAAAV